MKESLDIMSAVAGGAGSFIKGRKKKRPVKTLVLDVILGSVLGYLTIGVLDYFIVDQTPKVIMLVSFSVGWVANELTDLLEKVVVGSYDIVIKKLGVKVEEKTKENSNEENEKQH